MVSMEGPRDCCLGVTSGCYAVIATCLTRRCGPIMIMNQVYCTLRLTVLFAHSKCVHGGSKELLLGVTSGCFAVIATCLTRRSGCIMIMNQVYCMRFQELILFDFVPLNGSKCGWGSESTRE